MTQEQYIDMQLETDPVKLEALLRIVEKEKADKKTDIIK